MFLHCLSPTQMIEYLENTNNNTISENFAQFNDIGIFIESSENITLYDNEVINNTNHGLYLAQSNYSRIENTLAVNSTKYGIFLNESCLLLSQDCTS